MNRKTLEKKQIFTIGHSNHSLETFLALLKDHDIEVLVDIRSHPNSKYSPQFNGKGLKMALGREAIKYLFLGKELGGHPSGAHYYDVKGHVLYSRVAESLLFQEGITRLEKGIQQFRVAIMCSEEDPAECHRHLLVARVLVGRDVAVYHIRGDSSIQTEDELAAKELAQMGNYVQESLFEQQEGNVWKSTRSVLRKKQPPNSSGA